MAFKFDDDLLYKSFYFLPFFHSYFNEAMRKNEVRIALSYKYYMCSVPKQNVYCSITKYCIVITKVVRASHSHHQSAGARTLVLAEHRCRITLWQSTTVKTRSTWAKRSTSHASKRKEKKKKSAKLFNFPIFRLQFNLNITKLDLSLAHWIGPDLDLGIKYV